MAATEASRASTGAVTAPQLTAAQAAATASSSSASSTSLIHIGARVELSGLKAKPELNGRGGVVMRFSVSSDRYAVQMDDGLGSFSFKLGNLALHPSGDGEVVAHIPVGARVGLRGLKAKPELNGRGGIVARFVASSGRYGVLLDGEQNNVNLKSENLAVVSFGSHFIPFGGAVFEPVHSSLDSHLLDALVTIARRNQPADQDVKYWGGDPQPWRNGTDDSAIIDATVIGREELCKAEAEADDLARAPTPDAHADVLHGRGVSAAFLVYVTFKCDLWKKKTWEVVQFFVKPATEQLTGGKRRCFADIPGLGAFFGPATVFASHCWGGRWGDLVAAVCAGGDTQRMVWIDIFAVRQWPGNGADLDFKGVISRSTATIVAVAPMESGELAVRGSMHNAEARVTFLRSKEYMDVSKVLAFCRLWCLVELFTTIDAAKPLIFRAAALKDVTKYGVVLAGGAKVNEASHTSAGFFITDDVAVTRERQQVVDMLMNCSEIVNVMHAQSAVEADRIREMAAIESASADRGGLTFVNKILKASIVTGLVSTQTEIVEVDNFLCGEPDGLRKLPIEKVEGVVSAVCSAGLIAVLDELLNSDREMGGGGTCRMEAEVRRTIQKNYYPLFVASANGQTEIMERLLGLGADVNQADPRSNATPLLMACQTGQDEAVRLLLAQDTISVNAANNMGATPLFQACINGDDREGVVKLLLAHEKVDANQARTVDGITPLHFACRSGFVAIVKVLLAHGATDVNQATPEGLSPLYHACMQGQEMAVKLLLAHDAIDTNISNKVDGATPLICACQTGNEVLVNLLLAHDSTDVNQARTDDGVGPLLMACNKNHTKVVELLLAHENIDVNQVETAHGATPLFFACMNNYGAVVRQLLEKGSTQKATMSGVTPKNIAEARGHTGIVAMLQMAEEGALS